MESVKIVVRRADIARHQYSTQALDYDLLWAWQDRPVETCPNRLENGVIGEKGDVKPAKDVQALKENSYSKLISQSLSKLCGTCGTACSSKAYKTYGAVHCLHLT